MNENKKVVEELESAVELIQKGTKTEKNNLLGKYQAKMKEISEFIRQEKNDEQAIVRSLLRDNTLEATTSYKEKKIIANDLTEESLKEWQLDKDKIQESIWLALKPKKWTVSRINKILKNIEDIDRGRHTINKILKIWEKQKEMKEVNVRELPRKERRKLYRATQKKNLHNARQEYWKREQLAIGKYSTLGIASNFKDGKIQFKAEGSDQFDIIPYGYIQEIKGE
jgi:hypothetical protein